MILPSQGAAMWSCYFSIALWSYILTLCSFESAVGVVDLQKGDSSSWIFENADVNEDSQIWWESEWWVRIRLFYVKVQFGSVVVNVLPQTRWDVTENLNTLTKIPGGKNHAVNVCESELGHLLPVGIWVVAASLIAVLDPRLDFATSFT